MNHWGHFYHVVRVREMGLRADNPVIAYFLTTQNPEYAERFADQQEYVGGTYMDVFETEDETFDMSFLAAA